MPGIQFEYPHILPEGNKNAVGDSCEDVVERSYPLMIRKTER